MKDKRKGAGRLASTAPFNVWSFRHFCREGGTNADLTNATQTTLRLLPLNLQPAVHVELLFDGSG